jgi:hypothetical protein
MIGLYEKPRFVGREVHLVLAKKAALSVRGLRISLHHKDAAFRYIPGKRRWAICLFWRDLLTRKSRSDNRFRHVLVWVTVVGTPVANDGGRLDGPSGDPMNLP